MRDFLDSLNVFYVVDRLNSGGETCMHTEQIIVYDGTYREVIEKICYILPHIGIAVLTLAFGVEAIHLSDLAGLVIASQQSYAHRIS